MNWYLDLQTPAPLLAICATVAGIAFVILVVRLTVGPTAELARHVGLLVVRCFVVTLILLLLVNPVSVKELPGLVARPQVFYLLDASESMQMGTAQSRWDRMLEMIHQADEQAGQRDVDIDLFRFGNRLGAIPKMQQRGRGERPRTEVDSIGLPHIVANDTDTRLLMALRQITSRFGRSPPAFMVLFSDGRARNVVGLEETARHFAGLGVPIHVVPLGDRTKGGDVAIVAAVVPETVRRHSRVEVHVFLRSFGYDGRRIELQLEAVDAEGAVQRQLAPPQAVTLRSGVQTVTLAFRAELDTRFLQFRVPLLPDDVSPQNNSVKSELFISRQKIRVLYVEGSDQQPRPIRRGNEVLMRGPYTELSDALSADPDLECVVISGAGGRLQRVLPNGRLDSTQAFPQSAAELSAYDALIFSNLTRDQFTDEQIGRVER